MLRPTPGFHLQSALAAVLTSLVILPLSGCSWGEFFSLNQPTLSNSAAIDRALQLCSLTQGERPFHLILEVTPPPHSAVDMRAEIQVYWLNPSTYRTVIHSHNFNQVRIVNGSIVEERNAGDFYPRWIQNFVDGLLNPVPHVAELRNLPGKIPVAPEVHACIANPAQADGVFNPTLAARVCFQDAQPKLASGVDFTRSVWFSDFVPFGSQQIPRTLVNDLPADFLLQGKITLLEPLSQLDYPLLKARQYTPPTQQILSALVSPSTAASLLESLPDTKAKASLGAIRSLASTENHNQGLIYIRTDRTGQVREAYRDSSDHFGLQNSALAQVLTYKFKPLLIQGVAYQMEAPLAFPYQAKSTTALSAGISR
jgi:hypothetical protein